MTIRTDNVIDLSAELNEIATRISKTLHDFEDEKIKEQLVKMGWATPEQKDEILDQLIESVYEIKCLNQSLQEAEGEIPDNWEELNDEVESQINTLKKFGVSL